MLRSGFLLGVGGPAALLTLLVLPSVRASADRLVAPETAAVTAPASAIVPPYLPGLRPVSLEISPVRSEDRQVSTMPRTAPSQPANVGPSASEKEPAKPKRFTREGCEAPLSSLVGPEARRMVPGRCMA